VLSLRLLQQFYLVLISLPLLLNFDQFAFAAQFLISLPLLLNLLTLLIITEHQPVRRMIALWRGRTVF
jgi:hypothetical protein